jgi:chemotaxis protein CheD
LATRRTFHRSNPAEPDGEGEMNEIIDINTGQIAVRRGQCVLRAMALGSCIAVAAYDSRNGIAGMAHIMLPDGTPQRGANDTRYAVYGIETLLERMIEAGCDPGAIEVCLIGAGNVLRDQRDSICRDNIRSVTAILQAKNIPIRASVLGGNERKGAYLDAETGRVTFTEGSGSEQVLWPPEADSENNLGW